jgi:hypothetical protein
MKLTYYTLFLLIVLAACGKERATVAEVFYPIVLGDSTIAADGQSTVSVSVRLSDEAAADRKTVVFSTTGGSFTVSGNSKQTVKAEFENGQVIARAVLRAPFRPGVIDISVQPEFDSPVQEYVVKASVTALRSLPASIKLEPSALGIASNFTGEVRLVGSVKNSAGKNVSSDVEVVFDNELQNGAPANGRFREARMVTGDSSKVSAWYGASLLPIGTTIKIRATVLDADKNRTAISDSTFITINL